MVTGTTNLDEKRLPEPVLRGLRHVAIFQVLRGIDGRHAAGHFATLLRNTPRRGADEIDFCYPTSTQEPISSMIWQRPATAEMARQGMMGWHVTCIVLRYTRNQPRIENRSK